MRWLWFLLLSAVVGSSPAAAELTIRGSVIGIYVSRPQPKSALLNKARAYFRPTWTEAAVTHCAANYRDTRWLVADPENRLDPELKVPAALRERVVFWLNIYHRYPSQVRVIHDRDRLDIVYGVLDFSSLFQRVRPLWKAEAEAEKLERAFVQDLGRQIQELAELSTPGAAGRMPLRQYLSNHGVSTPELIRGRAQTLRVQRGQRDVFLLALSRSQQWLPDMEAEFAAKGLPRGLTRIPFVESSFHLEAESRTRAIGLWQFMPATARELIHPRDRKQWADPHLQTRAAARLLRSYRMQLPDWGFTVTAYNSGVGRMKKLSSRHRVWKFESLLAHPKGSNGLGFAGKNFFAELLAANLAEAYQHRWLPGATRAGAIGVAFDELSQARPTACLGS